MHSIHTFILHLLYDTQDPETLRGSLQAIGQDEVHTFVGEKNLCALTTHLIQAQIEVEELNSKEQNLRLEGQKDAY